MFIGQTKTLHNDQTRTKRDFKSIPSFFLTGLMTMIGLRGIMVRLEIKNTHKTMSSHVGDYPSFPVTKMINIKDGHISRFDSRHIGGVSLILNFFMIFSRFPKRPHWNK